jgi:hypothetical protein
VEAVVLEMVTVEESLVKVRHSGEVRDLGLA